MHQARIPALSALGLAVACGGSPTEPGLPAAPHGPVRATASNTATVTPGGASGSGSASTITLTIGPTTTATFQINAHKVRIVAGSICDPATSGYGPAFWDRPCTPAKSTIKVTAKSWTDAGGHPVVTFSPDLRFVPGAGNTIWLMDKSAAAKKAGVLAWCPTDGSACVDESQTDPSLATDYTADGYAFRRLKHFSGYAVVVN